MSKNARGPVRKREPVVPKVKRIELDDSPKMTKKRVVLFFVFLAIGLAGIAFGVRALVSTNPGWQRITVSANKPHAGDVSFHYEITSESKKDERRLRDVYSTASVELYDAFLPLGGSGRGLTAVNAHPNEEVTVGAELYRALEKILASGSRLLYAGPIHETHEALLFAADDLTAAAYDPKKTPAVGDFFEEIAAFIGDDTEISLSLLGEGRVKLSVSDAYMDFARDRELAVDGVVPYLSFGYTKNAFIIDGIAARLTEAGFTNGILTSTDGFSRLLAERDEGMVLTLFHAEESGFLDTGVGVSLKKPFAASYLSRLPVVSAAGEIAMSPHIAHIPGYYYVYEDGSVAAPYIDAAGNEKTAAGELIGFATDGKGCADLLLAQLKIYLADGLSAEELRSAAERGITSVWFADGEFRSTDPEIGFIDLAEIYGDR